MKFDSPRSRVAVALALATSVGGGLPCAESAASARRQPHGGRPLQVHERPDDVRSAEKGVAGWLKLSVASLTSIVYQHSE